MITYRITGTPTIGVRALRGITVLSGITLITLQARATAPPVSIVAGMSTQWLSVRHIRRAICGTARPMKLTGPH